MSALGSVTIIEVIIINSFCRFWLNHTYDRKLIYLCVSLWGRCSYKGRWGGCIKNIKKCFIYSKQSFQTSKISWSFEICGTGLIKVYQYAIQKVFVPKCDMTWCHRTWKNCPIFVLYFKVGVLYFSAIKALDTLHLVNRRTMEVYEPVKVCGCGRCVDMDGVILCQLCMSFEIILI